MPTNPPNTWPYGWGWAVTAIRDLNGGPVTVVSYYDLCVFLMDSRILEEYGPNAGVRLAAGVTLDHARAVIRSMLLQLLEPHADA